MIVSYKITVNFHSVLVIIQKDRNYYVIEEKIQIRYNLLRVHRYCCKAPSPSIILTLLTGFLPELQAQTSAVDTELIAI